jgi:septal ring factor EnvC (AmiA/AmiB activator)
VTRALLALLLVAAAAPAHARPAESLASERAAVEAERSDLERRVTTLDEQLHGRQRTLRRRLRALYKMSQGGAFRLVVDAQSLAELDERVTASERVIARDLDELAALDEEIAELARDRARRAPELTRDEDTRDPATATGLLRSRGALTRPVPGPINIGLQRVRIREPRAGAPALEVPRRSVELVADTGERVRAVAGGTVRWIGELEGVGRAIIVDHGERYVSVTGRLARVHLRLGARVHEGDVLGTAAGPTVSFELTEGRMALDPARWLRPPIAIVAAPRPAPSAASPGKAGTLAR